jgi:heme-degrading monooxygenase HmoA
MEPRLDVERHAVDLYAPPMNASPYWAVIFTSQRTEADPEGYAKTADVIEALAKEQPGFLGIDSTRDASGSGITVSYWENLEAIRAWRAVAEHRVAQERGKTDWYRSYRVRVARVEREYAFDARP